MEAPSPNDFIISIQNEVQLLTASETNEKTRGLLTHYSFLNQLLYAFRSHRKTYYGGVVPLAGFNKYYIDLNESQRDGEQDHILTLRPEIYQNYVNTINTLNSYSSLLLGAKDATRPRRSEPISTTTKLFQRMGFVLEPMETTYTDYVRIFIKLSEDAAREGLDRYKRTARASDIIALSTHIRLQPIYEAFECDFDNIIKIDKIIASKFDELNSKKNS